MSRLRTLSVLAGIIAALAISATPAAAWWRSTTGQTQGTVKVIKAGRFVDKGATIECPANGIKIQWHIQTKGQLKQHQINGKQELTTEGPHLHLQIKWGEKEFNCKSKASGLENIETNITSCEQQFIQQKRVFTATGGAVTGCVIKVGKTICELQTPPGMEKEPGSNEGINVGLKAIELENKQVSPLNQIDKINITNKGGGGTGQLPGEGLFVIQLPGHPLCPIATNEEGELLETELEAENIQAI